MALVYVGPNSIPNYTCLSTDIVVETGQVIGAIRKGATVFVVDSAVWKIVDEDNVLQPYNVPAAMTVESVTIDAAIAIDQTTSGTTNAVHVLPAGGVGSLTETAPATDTASSGLNGRLQRIAQRLTSLIALLPASLGQKTKTESLPVVLASDQDALAVTGTFFQATQPVSGTVTATGPITDTELRATPVPVSGTVTASGPLTNTELRAADVPVIPHGLADEIIVTPTLTVHATYASGDYVGTSLTPMEFANCARVNGGTGLIVGAMIADHNAAGVAGELWLFDAPVTAPADSSPWLLSGADGAKCIGVIPFDTYYASVASKLSFVNGQSIIFKTESDSRSLYGCFVTRGTPTYADTSLTFRLRVWQN